MPPVSGPKDFHLGIAMSGAVSAGAYTAGVFDYLIQTLDEWEKATNAPGVEPCHSLGLKVLTGASAGAITAAIGALALADGERKMHGFKDAKGQEFPYYLAKLYEAWVVRPTLVDETGGDNDLLSVSDLQSGADPLLDRYLHSAQAPLPATNGGNPVISLLNTRVLATIADAAVMPPTVVGAARSYLATPLNVYMTLTNLRGVPYKVAFGPGQGDYYYMVSHADRAHYAITGLGDWSTDDSISAFGVVGAKGKPLDAATLVAPIPDAWRDFSICALASGAFPIGLAPRVISAEAQTDYQDRLFPINELIKYRSNINLNWPPSITADPQNYAFTTVDGGTINNDPFEYAIFALKDAQSLEQTMLDAKYRSVIMISPFPEAKPIRPANQPRLDIVSIVTALFPSLIEQARFKPESLVLAAEEKVRSAFLISPSRVLPGAAKPQRYGIASGLLGGFGGFVTRAFRDHDFQLGRRNCQYFLKNAFTLPSADPLFKDWSRAPAHIAASSPGDRASGADGLRLIPICGSANPEVPLPEWPRLSQAQFETLMTRIAKRFDALAPAFIEQNVTGILQGVLRLLLAPVIRNWPRLPREKILQFARQTILADLVRRDQIEGWDLPASLPDGVGADEARLVLGELLEPAYDLHSAKGILAAISPRLRHPDDDGLDAAGIEDVLDRLKSAEGAAKVWEAPYKYGTARLFALDQRKPSVLGNVLGVDANLSWFKPSADTEGRANV